jgi:hypothetical protein
VCILRCAVLYCCMCACVSCLAVPCVCACVRACVHVCARVLVSWVMPVRCCRAHVQPMCNLCVPPCSCASVHMRACKHECVFARVCVRACVCGFHACVHACMRACMRSLHVDAYTHASECPCVHPFTRALVCTYVVHMCGVHACVP